MVPTPLPRRAWRLVPSASGKTDVGRKRDHNEDQILLTDGIGLFAVADGMGGHDAGDVASSVAAAALEEFFLATEEYPSPDDLEAPEALPLGARRLVSAVRHANREVFARSGKSANQGGMGATVVALYIDQVAELVHICHVGDSRCYRLRDGQLEQLTVDHSMINEALRLNPDLSDEILRQLPSNVITRALGTKEQVEPDVRSEPLLAGDTYLLCSDGLSGEVTDEELRFALEDQEDLGEACDLLVAMANDAGGRDNISAVLVRLEPHEHVASQPQPATNRIAEKVDGEERFETLDDEDLKDADRSEEEELERTAKVLEIVQEDEEEDLLAEELEEEIDEDEEELDDEEEDEEEEEELDDDELELTDELETVRKPGRGRRPSPPRPAPSNRRVSAAELRLDEAVDAALAEVDNEQQERWKPRSRPSLIVVGDAEPDPIAPVPVVSIGHGEHAETVTEARGATASCDACGNPVDPIAKFCGLCGERIPGPEPDPDVLRCEACNAVLLAGTRFCVECGTRHPWGD